MSILLDPQSSALVVLSPQAKLAREAMAIAGTSEILCCAAQPDGAAYNGATPNLRHFAMHGGSAFHGSELDLVLRSNFISHVAFAGDTIGRLLHDAEEARLRGYDAAVVVEAADVARATALSAELFGAKAPVAVLCVDDLARHWPPSNGEPRAWRPSEKNARLLATLDERLDPRHTAYIVVDVQNDFCRVKREETETFSLIEPAVRNVHALLDGARASGCTVVHVQAEYGPLFRAPGHPGRYPAPVQGQFVFTPSASEFVWNKAFNADDVSELCKAGTWGEQFVGIVPREGEIVLRKHRYSAFVDTGLDVILRKRGIRTTVIVGVVTNVCVESTSRDASMRDFYTVIAADAVGTRDAMRSRHDNALEGLSACFGLVVPASRILDIWARSRMDAVA